MKEKTIQQIKWFTFELLLIRTNPELVDGKYSQPIIFDLNKIRNCEDPEFELTTTKTPNEYATYFLSEIRGYYASKHNIASENSGLSFKKVGNQLKIYGYTTAILKRYLKDEHNCLPTVFDIYEKNHKFYILFIDRKTDTEISGDMLTALKMLREKCYDENKYIKWDVINDEMSKRRNLLRENNLTNFADTREQKINYIYQTIAVKLARLLKNAININNSNYSEKDIIDNKYGGNYRLAI